MFDVEIVREVHLSNVRDMVHYTLFKLFVNTTTNKGGSYFIKHFIRKLVLICFSVWLSLTDDKIKTVAQICVNHKLGHEKSQNISHILRLTLFQKSYPEKKYYFIFILMANILCTNSIA